MCQIDQCSLSLSQLQVCFHPFQLPPVTLRPPLVTLRLPPVTLQLPPSQGVLCTFYFFCLFNYLDCQQLVIDCNFDCSCSCKYFLISFNLSSGFFHHDSDVVNLNTKTVIVIERTVQTHMCAVIPTAILFT